MYKYTASGVNAWGYGRLMLLPAAGALVPTLSWILWELEHAFSENTLKKHIPMKRAVYKSMTYTEKQNKTKQ